MAREKKPEVQRLVDAINAGAAPVRDPADEETLAFDAALAKLDDLDAAAPTPVRTQDRDPAHREAWKRERAKALGHDRY